MCGFLGSVISVMLFFFVGSQIGFETFRQFAPGEHDAPPATFTFEPDIGTKARHRPFVGTAWMLLAQAQEVVQAKVREHLI